MKLRLCAAVAAGMMCSATSVSAEEVLPEKSQQIADSKDFFFSQPGIARETARADWEECRDLSSAVTPPPQGYAYTPNLIAAGAIGLVQGFIRGSQRRHMYDAALRKCMAVKGYRRIAMSEEEAKLLFAGEWPEMRERLVDRAVAPAPAAGELLP